MKDTMPVGVDLAELVRSTVPDAAVEQLRAGVLAVLGQHHALAVVDAVSGPYVVCAACCSVDDVQSETCRRRHEHFEVGSSCWPCSTVFALARALGVKVPELGLW